MFTSRALLAAPSAIAALLLLSCSSGPSAPQPGTPAFYWATAKTTWNSGDYVKALDNLAPVADTQNEFTARARPWRIVTAAGIARGYMDLADAYEKGAHATRQRSAPFLRQMNAYRSSASRASLQVVEAFRAFSSQANPTPAVPFDFPWPPAGNAADPQRLPQISGGALLSPDQTDAIEVAMIQRGVLLAVTAATGAGEDAVKAQAAINANHGVPAEDFKVGVAQQMFQLAALYGATKMDMPNKRDLLYSEAIGVMKLYPKNKTAAGVTTKIQKEQKKSRQTI